MKYDDAPAAITWLCRAFGFEEHMVIPGDDGAIVHAQLTYDGGMIMLGSARDTEFDRLQKTPRAVGGVGTQSAYGESTNDTGTPNEPMQRTAFGRRRSPRR